MSVVKPIIIERDGVDLSEPNEINPTSDMIQTLGVAFKGLATYSYQLIGGVITEIMPTYTEVVTYLANGDVNYIEFFNGTTQTTINRIARVDITYSGNNPTQENWRIYATSDGTTVLKTFTVTNSFSGNDLTSSQQVIS